MLLQRCSTMSSHFISLKNIINKKLAHTYKITYVTDFCSDFQRDDRIFMINGKNRVSKSLIKYK